jgi:hypothetical protein
MPEVKVSFLSPVAEVLPELVEVITVFLGPAA